MRRMSGPGEDDRQMQLFLRSRSLPRAKDGSDLEEADVAPALTPVVLHTANQTREQTASEIALLGRQRVLNGYGFRSIRGTEGQRAHLEQPSAATHQLVADAPQRHLSGGVGHRAGTVGSQLVGEGVVATEPG